MKDKNIPSYFLNSFTYSLAITLFGLLAYSAILIIGVPSIFVKVFAVSPVDLRVVFIFVSSAAILYFAYRPSGWLGTFTSFTTTLVLFAVQLSTLWQSTKISAFFVVGGLLPVNDAANYFAGALNLLTGNTLNTLSSWRPLAHGVTATLLGLTQQNLQVTLAIIVLITAISCFFLAREVQRTHGTMAGVLVLVTVFLYSRNYVGTVMTENLGLALGSVGLASLWQGTANRQIKFCLLGIFLLTLALNARAGTFFILPAFVLWGTWLFRGSSRFSWHFLLGGCSVVFLGFMINSLVSKVVGNPNVMANSNFSYVFYGMVVGGDWSTVFINHPELKDVSGKEVATRVYQLALEKLRANPFALLIGYLRAWKQFLLDDFIFSFADSAKVNVGLQILTLIGIFGCYRQRKSAIGSLMIVSAISILLSVPFVPPWDAGIRPYAATIPLFAMFPALGLVFIAQKFQCSPLLQVPHSIKESKKILAFFGISLALLTFIGPIGTKILSQPPQFSEISCPPGMEAVYFRNSAGSFINIVADNAISRTNVPNVRISDFKIGLSRVVSYPIAQTFPIIDKRTKELANLKPNTTIITTIELKKKLPIWVIVNTDKIPKESGIIGACGKKREQVAGEWFYLAFFFYADSVTLVSR